jgi:hypothetical protein
VILDCVIAGEEQGTWHAIGVLHLICFRICVAIICNETLHTVCAKGLLHWPLPVTLYPFRSNSTATAQSQSHDRWIRGERLRVLFDMCECRSTMASTDR